MSWCAVHVALLTWCAVQVALLSWCAVHVALLTWCAVHVAQFLSTTAIAAVKGSDASGVHDEEPPAEVISRDLPHISYRYARA